MVHLLTRKVVLNLTDLYLPIYENLTVIFLYLLSDIFLINKIFYCLTVTLILLNDFVEFVDFNLFSIFFSLCFYIFCTEILNKGCRYLR